MSVWSDEDRHMGYGAMVKRFSRGMLKPVHGASQVEYGFLVGLVALFAVVSISGIGNSILHYNERISNAVGATQIDIGVQPVFSDAAFASDEIGNFVRSFVIASQPETSMVWSIDDSRVEACYQMEADGEVTCADDKIVVPQDAYALAYRVASWSGMGNISYDVSGSLTAERENDLDTIYTDDWTVSYYSNRLTSSLLTSYTTTQMKSYQQSVSMIDHSHTQYVFSGRPIRNASETARPAFCVMSAVNGNQCRTTTGSISFYADEIDSLRVSVSYSYSTTKGGLSSSIYDLELARADGKAMQDFGTIRINNTTNTYNSSLLQSVVRAGTPY